MHFNTAFPRALSSYYILLLLLAAAAPALPVAAGVLFQIRAIKSSWIEEIELYDIDTGKTNTFYKNIRNAADLEVANRSHAGAQCQWARLSEARLVLSSA